ncbi:heat shock protein HslJ [Psychromonas sp. CNPT3]|uniref:META domain-containing protein n=1 Tax=Psychromonas sp. CNPT3 TaxID=314282 RepID=UPI00006E5057|nr:META domain-containing protein [Psychromonas sp. CNPT3]AGH82433.1 heat shock protein HslJ [Psychromonas sp. CNPT3]
MKKRHVVALLASTLLFACQDKATQLQPSNWTLSSIDGQSINSKIHSNLSIDTDGRAHGVLACNNFFGEVVTQDKNIRIEKMGSTRKMCVPPVNKVEMQVSQTLSNWSEIQVSGTQLTLSGEKYTLIYQLSSPESESK